MNEDELYKKMSDANKTWFTSEELASETKSSPSELEAILNNSKLFVRSFKNSEKGEKLFSTRKDFAKNASFLTKLAGAFKSRID